MKWFRPHPYYDGTRKNDDLVSLDSVVFVNCSDGQHDPKYMIELTSDRCSATLYYDNPYDRDADFNTIKSM